jgi:hypothetical protein
MPFEPSQYGYAFGALGQTAHPGPHAFTSSTLTHAPLQRCVPERQNTPHAVPSHVAYPFAAGLGHGEHELPHVAGSVLATQLVPQRW